MPLDYTYRVRQPHRTGQLATVAGAIAEGGGLIGDVTTINVGRDSSIREITLAVEDHDQAEKIVHILNDLEGVEVLWSRDRALLRHEGPGLGRHRPGPLDAGDGGQGRLLPPAC